MAFKCLQNEGNTGLFVAKSLQKLLVDALAVERAGPRGLRQARLVVDLRLFQGPWHRLLALGALKIH